MKPLESSFSKQAIFLLISYVTFQLALSETDHNIQSHLPRFVLDVSRKHFSPGGTLVISVPNNRTHVRRSFPGIGHTQENCESHDQVAKLLHPRKQWPIITSTPGQTSNITSFYKDQSYVIITSCQATFVHIIQNLELQLHALKARKSWNPRGQFLVLIPEQHTAGRELVRQVLELLWSFKAGNVVVAIPDTTQALVLYTWYPYQSPDLCTQVKEVKVNSWVFENDGHFLSGSSLFPPKIPYDLKRCNINASTVPIEPYVFMHNENSSDDRCTEGVECRLFCLIMDKLNMTFKLKLAGEVMWGVKHGNDSWTRMKGHLSNNISDIAFGTLFLDTELCDVFECTVPYFENYLVWYVPRAKEVAKWKSLFLVFELTTWLAFVAMCVAVVLLLWRMARNSRADPSETSTYANISKCSSSVWAALLGVSVPEMPRTTRLRVLFLLWLFYCLHINTVYLAFLTTFLIQPGFEHQIQNVEELVESDVEYGFHEGFGKYFNDSTDEILMKMLKNRKDCAANGTNCHYRTITKGEFAILDTSHNMEYLTANHSFEQSGKPLFYRLKDTFLRSNIVMYLTKGNHLLDRINNIITHAVEAGLIDQWWREMEFSWTLRRGTQIHEESSTLTLLDLQSAFIFLFLSLGFCIAVFMVERICFRRLKKPVKKTA